MDGCGCAKVNSSVHPVMIKILFDKRWHSVTNGRLVNYCEFMRRYSQQPASLFYHLALGEVLDFSGFRLSYFNLSYGIMITLLILMAF